MRKRSSAHVAASFGGGMRSVHMRSFITFLLAATVGLTLVPSALADSATGDLLLTRSDCSGASDVLGLSYDGGAYSGSCGSVPGVTPVTDTYASDTLPLPVTLDTARKIHIAIGIDSFVGSPL